MPYRDKERQKEYQRQHYLKNRASYKKRARAQRINMVKLQQSLKDKPCADCGVKYPYYVMDFDHVRGDKKTVVSAIFRFGSEKALLEEIAKCEVVCSNCHRERTHGRLAER